jgi:hypothetical protein
MQLFAFDKSMVKKIGKSRRPENCAGQTALNRDAEFPPYKCLSAFLHSRVQQNRAPKKFSPGGERGEPQVDS